MASVAHSTHAAQGRPFTTARRTGTHPRRAREQRETNMLATWETKCWDDIYRIRADFAQAASSVQMQDEDGVWMPTGKQVADFRHDAAAAMSAILTEVAEAGDGAEDEIGTIAAAVAQMIVVDD